MSTTAVIGLVIFFWVLVSVPAALFVARMIRLRDQRAQPSSRPESWTKPETPSKGDESHPSGNDPEATL
jgi:hypothetical protein